MSTSAAVVALGRTPRIALTTVGALGFLLATAGSIAAQSTAPQPSAWELRFTSGGLVATGAERNVVKDAALSAAQLSYVVRPSLAITATLGWARSHDLSVTDAPKLDVFAYDVGAEARGAEWFVGRAMTFAPFVGAGAGARSYNYRKLDVDATHNLAGYGAAGGEFGVRRVGIRLEVRDYVAGFKPLLGNGIGATRNDVVIMAGVRFNRQHAQKE